MATTEQQPIPMGAPLETSDRLTIARLADEVLPALIARLAKSELGELEVREDGWRIRLRRDGSSNTAGGLSGSGDGQTRSTPRLAGTPSVAAATQAERRPRPEPVRGLITSPAVGYFLAHDGVTAGSVVRDGDVVGHVDVLGVRQEIVTRVAGTLRDFDVAAGEAVEFGQPIVRVEASRAEADVR